MGRRMFLSMSLFVALAGVGCGPSAPAVMTRAEFEKLVVGKRLDAVRAAIGAPDSIDSAHKTWEYKGRTRKTADAKPDYSAALHPDGDVVQSVGYREEPPPP